MDQPPRAAYPAPPPLDSAVARRTGNRGGEPVEFESVNGSCWPTARDALRRTAAVVVCVQETRLLEPEAIAQATADLRADGWTAVFTPAWIGEGGGRCGGAAVLARHPFGMRPLAGADGIAPGRVAGAIVAAPGGWELAVFSTYLLDGEGLGTSNLATLAALGKALDGVDLQFVVGADWNVSPSTLQGSGFPERALGSIVHPSTRIGTCRGQKGRASTIDYFVVASGLEPMVRSCQVDGGSTMSPHKPVTMVMEADLHEVEVLVISMPPPSAHGEARRTCLAGRFRSRGALRRTRRERREDRRYEHRAECVVYGVQGLVHAG